MPQQVIVFVGSSTTVQDALAHAQRAINKWLADHPDALVSTIDMELIPPGQHADEWTYAISLAVQLPDAQD